MTILLDRARRLADDILFPAAADVDAQGVIPASHFTALADAGLYGIALPTPDGGPADLPAVTEVLAGACLTTTFTWMQHHGAVRTLASTAQGALRERYLAAAVTGELRCGVAFAGALPEPPRLWATREPDGYRLDGHAPLVTGWGLVDLVQVAARDTGTAHAPDEEAVIITALLDARAAPGLTAHPLALLAAQGSNTVRLRFDSVFVPDALVSGQTTRSALLAAMTASSRINGCLALGVAGRCVRLIADTGRSAVAGRLGTELDAARAELDAGLLDPALLPVARAAASELAYRVAGALVVAAGSTGILEGHPAGRLLREAAFTLVAAGREEIRTDLLARMTG
ncbi:MAG: acyl-CoA/acyl-ACP dehydrogenase [Pseudonocardiales bacterium]|nr:acyl-CoA/acyl-ACP dehydrogenase [Pseudonocardiales bacterium]